MEGVLSIGSGTGILSNDTDIDNDLISVVNSTGVNTSGSSVSVSAMGLLLILMEVEMILMIISHTKRMMGFVIVKLIQYILIWILKMIVLFQLVDSITDLIQVMANQLKILLNHKLMSMVIYFHRSSFYRLK